MRDKIIPHLTRSILVHHKAWKLNLLTASRIRLFHQRSNLVMLQKNHKSVLRTSLSTRTKNNSKTPLNERFLAFHKSLDNENKDYKMTHSEWEKLEQDILEESPNFVSHLDYSIMKSLSSKPDLNLSFYHYIKCKREPNVSTVVEFIINGAGFYDDLVLQEVENLTKSCDSNLFKVIGWKIAFGVAKTDQWRRAVKYVHLDHESNVSSETPAFAMRTLALVFEKSLKYKDYKTFHEVSEVWRKLCPLLPYVDSREVISHTFFHSWKDGTIPTDLLMELLKLGELPLEEDEVEILQNYCNNKWDECESAVQVKVESSLNCCSCDETVPGIEPIDDSVLMEMYNQSAQKMLRSNTKSEKEEVKILYNFLKRQKKQFDYVIDGLNVGKKFLHTMLKELQEENKNVLVTVRDYSRKELKHFASLSTVFNISQKHILHDDVHVLMAALLSGPKCYIVTNDDYRDHIQKVDLECSLNFHAWREQQRVFHVYGKLLLPSLYKWTAHESEYGWHIPCKKATKDSDIRKKDTGIPNALLIQLYSRRFLCVRKLNYVPSPELLSFREAAKSLNKQK